ncbi:PIN domain-like protein [Mycena maculata]|uniref:PIN domain-like protein n=1 Tax=Mycena maculata TaxID=230809 RepID=A0AAD7NHZ3_9AGAR|nr:PIN domain-like protein [Mycena maculata]
MGVKSLWKLLAPVGRPVMLEAMEGQIMAIDSSIWIYQFQATMRDNDGRALSNAHVLGFLRRIAKLLFYGIKPVFVFDGGAPALKRNTLNERKRKKSGAATNHAKLAEKLLAAQLRRAALNHASGTKKPANGKGKGKAPIGPVVLDDNTVYLEDIDPSIPKTPARSPNAVAPSSVSPDKPKFHDHDPYRLPDIDLEAAVASATRAAVPDPRLATEDELREFIEDMRPEDFDVTSPAFRELPTEVQYEIVGDLRLKSRQTSYARLQNMLKSAPTPLDFSKQQIQNLRQRNTLTQQLLMTTDSIGKANITIPIRVASERNREYVLVKNEGHDGGWILGIRDDGTRVKPIEIDQDEKDKDKAVPDNDSDDEDMEEVPIPQAGVPDADLQEYQRTLNLVAIANRQAPKKSVPPSKHAPEAVSRPLFDFDDNNDVPEMVLPIDDEDDGELAFAIQESIDQANASKAAPVRPRRPPMVNAVASSSKLVEKTPRKSSDSVTRYSLQDDDTFLHRNRLETALSIANAGLVRTPTKPVAKPSSSLFGEPILLQQKPVSPASRSLVLPESNSSFGEPALLQQQPPSPSPASRVPTAGLRSYDEVDQLVDGPTFGKPVLLQPSSLVRITPSPPPAPRIQSEPSFDSDEEMEEVPPVSSGAGPGTFILRSALLAPSPPNVVEMEVSTDNDPDPSSPIPQPVVDAVPDIGNPPDSFVSIEPSFMRVTVESTPFSDSQTLVERGSVEPLVSSPNIVSKDHAPQQVPFQDDTDDGEPFSDWSRSPSPIVGLEQPQLHKSSPVPEDWDAAQEMDLDAEEGEFARFMSQVKGKDLDEVQREIDDEIKVLNTQKKAAMRDSEDINQQMIAQIMTMLRMFGIPYITAPMEAEAQCAELVHLGLVNGVITDDSDVFLFGSQRVFKNMFNQSKTVECFLLADLSRELGLDRDTLIRLAYLLGSDYVDGLPGIGPVVAMELLDEFPGQDGLHKFKDWWTKVQSGKDTKEDNKSKFRKRFKMKFKNLYLPPEWPNPTVRDAYYHPTVDDSDDPFKWGLPDLDALREFLYAELSWPPDKVDELLLPVIQKIRKRGQSGALNKQGDLNGFFEITGSGTVAPRKRQAYTSKRLQQVVSDFRKKRKHGSKSPPAEESDSHSEDDEPIPVKKAKVAKTKPKPKSGTAPERGTGRGRGRGAKKGSSRKKAVSKDEGEFQVAEMDTDQGLAVQLRPRPKPAYKGSKADVDDEDEEV